ncbi:MAG: [FeFe] hydrogenase H-cluster radical SAM maturase HydE [Kiritimatiellia bacterium]
MTALDRALAAPKSLTREELVLFLASDDAGLERDLFAAAREAKVRCGKDEVLLRGLVECSNACAKDCLYCGIRKGNGGVVRYRMPEHEVLACCDEARRRGYPAVAFQAGEIESEENTAYYERLLAGCRGLEVTLSLGEQTEAVYRRWKAAGALRYLIRIETSNRALFSQIHPAACSFDRRLDCIRTLKRLGYVTGSGVMIGLPGQTVEDLARDILFFGEENLDMVGMGPFVPTPGTPLAASRQPGHSAARALALALRMIALARLYLHRVNIVAATALEALDPSAGRDRGIQAGANVVMPNLTPRRYGENYRLYPGKAAAVS